jgi:methyl-accepting chemotaxis protein
MSWLNNFKITFKIGLIVALMVMVTVGAIGFAIRQMRAMDDANTDMVTRIDRYTTQGVRAARRANVYVSAAFQLATDTTDAGNKKFLAETVESRANYEAMMAKVLQNMPEKATAIEPVMAGFKKAFAVCDPVIDAASRKTSSDDAVKLTARLKAECVPGIESAIAAQTKLTDMLLAGASKAADDMTLDANSSIKAVIIAAGLGLAFSLALALWIGTKGLSGPIGELKAVMEAFARNDFKAAVPGISRGDEVGEMARTVEVFKVSGLAVERMTSEQNATEQRTAAQRKTEMNKLASDFEGAVGEIIQTVSSASTELEASANTLSATAQLAQQQTSVVAAASEEASANVQSVASATEEMASSVNEISRQVQESSRIANEAVN